MITKFIKAQTKSDELAEIVSILLEKFGSVYDLIYEVKDILVKNDYGYKLKSLWNLVLDCILHVDKESNKSVLSLLIKLVNDHLKKYTEENDLEQGEIALSLVKSAVLLFNVAKAFDYDTSIFSDGQKQKHKNSISDKTFDLLNKIIEDENFKSFFELDVTLRDDLKSIQVCFEQMKNLKFEVIYYLTNEIFNPNVEHLEQFSPLLKKCADICEGNNKITIFNLIQQTKEFTQKKVSKMDRIDKIKNGVKKIKNYAHEVKEHNLENKNLFLDKIQTENEKESRRTNDLLKKLLKQAKKVVGSIDVGERGSYLLHSDLLNEYFNSLYEIFCMVYDPKCHSNLNFEYKNTYREIISDSCNSTVVTKISGYTVSAITSLNKKNIFKKIDEIENIDTEIIGSIIWLIDANLNNQAVFFKNENGESIIFSLMNKLKQLQENLINYKKKLRLFNTDQLLNELKNYKGQETSFAYKLIKKVERQQERLLNNLEIKSGQFDAELYKKKKKVMTQLTDLNICTMKLIALLCILKSNNNYVFNVVDTVNKFCKKLHDFLDTLYVSEDKKNLNSGYKGICAEIISDQKQLGMVIEISKFTIDAIKFLNEKYIFEKVDSPKYEGGENIDIKTIDSVILLLSNISQKDIVFFKNEKGENITSDIIDGFKLLKTNLKINELRQKFQECKLKYPECIYTFTSSSNECFKDLHDFLLVLKEPKSEEQDIYTAVLSNKKNPQMFMIIETSNIILDVIKILNSKEFEGEKLKDIDDQTIGSIIELLSEENKKTDIVFFKDAKGENITSDIIGGFKLLKTNLKINELRQKFQECKSKYPDFIYTFRDSSNQCFKDLHNFLSILKGSKSREQEIYTEVLSVKQNSQMFMIAETSNIIIYIIKILNSKDFDRKNLKDIDANIIEAIIELLSQNKQGTDIIFFKDEKGENITSDIIDSLKLLKENLTAYIYNQENEKIKPLLDNLRFFTGMALPAKSFGKITEKIKSEEINNCLNRLYYVFCILYDTEKVEGLKSEYKEIYKRIICDPKNAKLVFEMSQDTEKLINELNEQDFFDSIDNHKDIDVKTIDYIVSLFSKDRDENTVLFKNDKNEDITSNIIDGLKLFKDKLLQCINKENNLQENENQIVDELKEKKEEPQRKKSISGTTRSDEINSNSKYKPAILNSGSNKNNDNDYLQNNGGKIENTDTNEENNVVEDNENISSQVNNNTKKIQNVNNMNKDSNEKQIEENRQNVQSKIDLKANDTFSLLKNEFDKTEEVRKKAENKKYSLNMAQNKIKSLINNKDKNVGNGQRKNNTENVVFENKKDQNKINIITTNEKEINEKQIEVKKQNVENEIDNKFRLIKNAFNINDKEKDENNNKTTDRKHSFSASQDKIEFSLANENENLENKPNNNNIETDFFKNNLLNSEENKKSNSRTDDQKEFDEKQVSNEQNSILNEGDNKIKAQGSKDNNSSNLDINSDTNNNSFLAKDSSNINYRNQNENIERVSTNTLRGQKNNDKANANNSGVDTSKQKIQKYLTGQSDHCAFFLKKWCIFFYQRKKISISITVFSAIFLAVGLLFAHWLAITAVVSLVIDLTIFLFGKCFSTGSCSKNITTNIDNINKNYEIGAYNSELVPTLVLCKNKKESDLYSTKK